ncbi:HAD family hydrolase [Phytoactinopolyspora endophytica]|uniref:HAD family hydrolase n=1 Tax=Phytoactinopolyspora endophytica TaxID=1642495 RepID=UPI00197C3BB5|nr:HAD-IA family hydrolase [Phytoactinopolyspora endophytica]
MLFDSGGVLMQPIGGRWNPRADFEQVVLSHVPSFSSEQFAPGIAAGQRFLDEADETPDYEQYHRVVLRHLGIEATRELLDELQRPVEPAVILETFPEVKPTLQELRARGVRMAVVSDAWPDLRELHAGLGLHTFFEAYAISAELGCNKPDPRMYQHASEALGLTPAECLFVDDDPGLVAAAIELGYQGRAVCRDGRPAEGVASIAAIDEILAFF